MISDTLAEMQDELVPMWQPFWDPSCNAFAWRDLGSDSCAWTVEQLPDDAFEETDEQAEEEEKKAEKEKGRKVGVGFLLLKVGLGTSTHVSTLPHRIARNFFKSKGPEQMENTDCASDGG